MKVKAKKQGKFLTNDGRTITSYMDLHTVFADIPLTKRLAHAIVESCFAPELWCLPEVCDVWVVGVDFGGYPIARAIAEVLYEGYGLNAKPILCRKKVKEYGDQDKFAPALVPHKDTRIIVVEDVSARRVSIEKACNDVHEYFASSYMPLPIFAACSVIDRGSDRPLDIMLCKRNVPYRSFIWDPEETIDG